MATGGTGYRADGKLVIGTSVDVGGIDTGLNKIQSKMNKLKKTLSLAVGITAFYKLGKAAISAASDLEEVQNMVDVSFKKLDEAGNVIWDMTGKIEAFAQTSVDQFGMSALTAKQTASSFMAMARAMGFTGDQASDMSIKMTQLSGDFASFYNLSQDYARVALSAVFTGETETIKRYGIILTEANLQEYANKLGIEKKVKAMNAQEKALLRYKLLMESLEPVEGDFVRTQNSWANQTRLLKEHWNELMVAMGTGLTSVLAPLLKIINKLLVKATQAISIIWGILANIFGFDLKSLTQPINDIVSDIGDGSDSMEDLEDNINGAAKAAKKALAPFDELAVIPEKMSGSGSSAEPIDLTSFIIPPEITDMIKDQTEDILSDIDNMFDFGKYLGEAVVKGFKKIDWATIKANCEEFARKIAQFLNGVFESGAIAEFGTFLAETLNTAVSLAFGFVDELDWDKMGEQLGKSISNFFENFDWAKCGQAISKFCDGLVTLLTKTITNTDWSKVFSGIGTLLSNLSPSAWFLLIGGFAIKKGLLGALSKAILSAFSAKSVGDLVLKSGLAKNLGKAIGTALSGLGTTILAKLGVLLGDPLLQIPGFFNFGEGIGYALSQAFSGLPTLFANLSISLGSLVSLIGGLLGMLASFFSAWNNGWNGANAGLYTASTLLAVIGAALAGISAVPIAIGAAIAVLVLSIRNHWEEVKQFFSDSWEEFKQIVGGLYDEYIAPAIDSIKEAFDEISTTFKETFGPLWDLLSEKWAKIQEWWEETGRPFFEGIFGKLAEFFDNFWVILKADWAILKTALTTKLSVIFQTVGNLITTVAELVGNSISTFIKLLGDVWNFIKHLFGFIISFLEGDLDGAWLHLKGMVKSVVNFILDLVGGLVNTIIIAINGVLRAIAIPVNAIIDAINTISFDIPDWVPKYGGQRFGFDFAHINMPQIPKITMPRLASGAVIPPNNEFMAVLGDQKHGTNIETPLDTMVEAFTKALDSRGGNQQPIVLQLNGREVAKVVWDEENKRYRQTGAFTPSYAR